MDLTNEVGLQEILHRYISSNPDLWSHDFNRISSAAFKDKNGTSVDRDGGRSHDEIKNDFLSRQLGSGKYRFRCIAYINTEFCVNLPALVLAKPLPNNDYHAEIHDSFEKKELTRSKLIRIAERCMYYS